MVIVVSQIEESKEVCLIFEVDAAEPEGFDTLGVVTLEGEEDTLQDALDPPLDLEDAVQTSIVFSTSEFFPETSTLDVSTSLDFSFDLLLRVLAAIEFEETDFLLDFFLYWSPFEFNLFRFPDAAVADAADAAADEGRRLMTEEDVSKSCTESNITFMSFDLLH